MILSCGDLQIVVDRLSGENRFQLLYIAFGQAKGVQFGELCVRRHPRKFGLEAAESTGQDAHPLPFSGVGSVSLDRLAILYNYIGDGQFH